MKALKSWLWPLLLLPGVVCASENIDFHYANAQVLAATDPTGANEAWFARCAAGGQFADLAPGYAPDPRLTREHREAAEKAFDRQNFERIAQTTYDRVIGDLPQTRLTLCVDFTSPDNNFVRDKMKGVMALTAGSGKVLIKLHPQADWATFLPYVLAHELHHSYWAQHHYDPKAAFTLGDYLIFEGRADYYAAQVFGQHPAPWIDALDDVQYAAATKTFRAQLADTSPQVLMGAMFGNPQAGIPLWAGYTVGYRWVAGRLNGLSRHDWAAITAIPARDFVPAE
ncbi:MULTISPECIES: DUF2268 domain-containing putative Zn-dependent protease [Pseudomonas]|uniref:DUF2268 domain-containing putative Zn-dependent protease n=1 Tax=Pseudomonas TaxID=286 RepID=UPI00235FC658|nr:MULTISPECIES: DUF2268 domain-containing putative Zn-dependent protease [Pseudomonas]WJV25648.1 DUF2268 domain-containing putative Zn-dependent protease [Pseudomonas chlororaphis]